MNIFQCLLLLFLWFYEEFTFLQEIIYKNFCSPGPGPLGYQNYTSGIFWGAKDTSLATNKHFGIQKCILLKQKMGYKKCNLGKGKMMKTGPNKCTLPLEGCPQGLSPAGGPGPWAQGPGP